MMDDYEPNPVVRVGRRLAWTALGLILAAAVYWGYAQVQIERQLRANMNAAVYLLNYNLQQGTLKVPPQAPVQAQAQAAPAGPPRP